MAQFDVFVRRGGPGVLIDCQADTLSKLNTRFVVPALPQGLVPSVFAKLNPAFEIEDRAVILMPQNAATVSTRELGQPIGSFARHRYEVMNALDMLLTGY